jgi:hypothetical protein
MKTAIAVFLLFITGILGGVAMATEQDVVVGTWKLNVAKSTFTSGGAIKSQTRTYTQTGWDITVVIKSVAADGTQTTSQSTYKVDGKDYPVTGNPDYDTLSGRQSNTHEATFTLVKSGKPIGKTARSVSLDGKTLTVKSNYATAAGGKIESTLVFNRK